MRNHIKNNGKVNALLAYIKGQEFDLAKEIIGLGDGSGPEHRQRCPVCQAEGERFFFQNEKFRCQKCKFNGTVVGLVAKVRKVPHSEAEMIVTEAAGYVESADHRVAEVKSPLTDSAEQEPLAMVPVEQTIIVAGDHTEDLHASKETLKLFASQPQSVGNEKQTLFLTEAAEISEGNEGDFFKYDYTPNKFTGGWIKGKKQKKIGIFYYIFWKILI